MIDKVKKVRLHRSGMFVETGAGEQQRQIDGHGWKGWKSCYDCARSLRMDLEPTDEDACQQTDFNNNLNRPQP